MGREKVWTDAEMLTKRDAGDFICRCHRPRAEPMALFGGTYQCATCGKPIRRRLVVVDDDD